MISRDKNKVEAICRICKRPYFRRARPSMMRLPKNVRPRRSVTCSKRCGRENIRLIASCKYIKLREYRKKKKEMLLKSEEKHLNSL